MLSDLTTYNQVYSAFAFIGFVLCCIPISWHLQAWNSGTCLWLFWTGLACLNQFINSVIWNGNVVNWAPVWCDISIHITVIVSLAIPISGLCISRRLYCMVSEPSAHLDPAVRRRAVLADLSIGGGLPLIFGVLYYITAQGHRFNIFEDIGCNPPLFLTPVSIAFIIAPPILASLVSSIYCVRVILAIRQRRSKISELLAEYADCNRARYTRLLALVSLEALISTTCTTAVLAVDVSLGVSPWISWEDTHSNFSMIQQVPSVFWRAGDAGEYLTEFVRWLVVFVAFVVFGFFGFAEEARSNYRKVFGYLMRLINRIRGKDSRMAMSPSMARSDTLLFRQSSMGSTRTNGNSAV